MHALRAVFGLDVRSLATFRILISAILLIDLVCRLPDVHVFLTDGGILSRSLLLEMQSVADPSGFNYQWSLHLFSGHAWGQCALMALAGLFAIWLLIGYQTRLATVISWALFVSLANRNPLTFDAGDAVLRSLMFWAMFVPLGSVWSVDAIRRRRATAPGLAKGVEPPLVVSFGSAALICQLLVVYFSAALFKMNPVWLSEFSGVYYALNCDPFTTRFGLAVRELPWLMKVLTAGTIFLEFVGPLAMLVPWWNWRIRVFVVTAMCCMHLGMAATMTLGIFPWICIAAWLMLVPPQVWQVVWPRLRRVAESRFITDLRRRWIRLLRTSGLATGTSRWSVAGNGHRRAEESLDADGVPPTAALEAPLSTQQPASSPGVARLGTWGHRLQEFAACLLFLYAIVWNAIDGLPPEIAKQIFPDEWNRLARVLALEKNWSMFAPIPRPEDGWPVFKGTLHDGSVVNLWQPDQPLPWQKPPVVSDMYLSQRWRRYLENLTMEPYALYRPYFADWLQQRWNRQFGVRPERQVATVELVRQVETTPPPGEPLPQPETIELWTKQYAP